MNLGEPLTKLLIRVSLFVGQYLWQFYSDFRFALPEINTTSSEKQKKTTAIRDSTDLKPNQLKFTNHSISAKKVKPPGILRILRRPLKRKLKMHARGYRKQAKLGSYKLHNFRTLASRSSCAAAMVCIESKLIC